MDERENLELFDELIRIWNEDSFFNPDAVWRTYEK